MALKRSLGKKKKKVFHDLKTESKVNADHIIFNIYENNKEK